MEIRKDISSSDGRVFSEDILKIEICGPDEDYLTVIDVPGIFRDATEGFTTKKDIKLVRNMVKKYIKNNRTIILAVLPSNVDIATQEILSLAKEYDKAGERTLGVLTKPDMVTEHSAQVAVCNLVLGKKRPLTLGYYVVRSRGADNDDNFDHDVEEQMFRNEPWSGLPKDRLGVQALKVRLGELLGQITRREFPGLRKDVSKRLTDCQRELEGLGPARQTEQEQRLFLSAMARHLQQLVQAALEARYSNHSAFEEKQELRLITHILSLTEAFSDDFLQRAHLRHFERRESSLSESYSEEDVSDHEEDVSGHEEDVSGHEEHVSDHEEMDTWANVSKKLGNKFLENIDLEEFTVLDNTISKDFWFDDPEDNIMVWIEGLYLRSRSIDLGTFGGSILSSAFKEQSSKWSGMTKAYVSKAIVIIHRFLIMALETLCTDARIREEIWSSILDDVLNRYKMAMEQAMFLVSVERDKRPYTLNHYFNDNLQIARGNRIAKMLKSKARKETTVGSHGMAMISDNLIVDLESVKNATTSKSNVKHVKEEIHDILFSYYRVARKRFVDNVYHQAIDHYLLTGPLSPLVVFSQEWVIKLEAEQLETIASESFTTKERRATLTTTINDLMIAMRILRS